MLGLGSSNVQMTNQLGSSKAQKMNSVGASKAQKMNSLGSSNAQNCICRDPLDCKGLKRNRSDCQILVQQCFTSFDITTEQRVLKCFSYVVTKRIFNHWCQMSLEIVKDLHVQEFLFSSFSQDGKPGSSITLFSLHSWPWLLMDQYLNQSQVLTQVL